ncbi:MAG: FRG domain-containing protein [Planctomycetes bacterium]|nr:FRG domain-containing protein [Planctomycetota bacterium]
MGKLKRIKLEPEDSVRIGSVRTFLDVFDDRRDDTDYVYFYRGHSNFSYESLPSIFRNSGWIKNEDVLFQELILKCPGDFPNQESTFQKLVKMQHYSLPTRLLDLTANPLAALYFACSSGNDSRESGEVIFFKIRKSHIKYFDSDTVSVISNLSRRPKTFILPPECSTPERFSAEPEIQYLIHEIKKEKPYFEPKIQREHLRTVVCVKPLLNNPRIIRQDGAFLLFGMNRTKTECAILPDNILYSPKKMRVLVIPEKKRKILEQLEALGITQATLFPEVDHVSLHIKDAYYIKNTKDEN